MCPLGTDRALAYQPQEAVLSQCQHGVWRRVPARTQNVCSRRPFGFEDCILQASRMFRQAMHSTGMKGMFPSCVHYAFTFAWELRYVPASLRLIIPALCLFSPQIARFASTNRRSVCHFLFSRLSAISDAARNVFIDPELLGSLSGWSVRG